MKNDGGPAFPYSALVPDAEKRQLVNEMYADSHGMTLRDYFAAAALTGIIAAPDANKQGAAGMAAVVGAAFEIADAMLEHREKE